jgi:hypothetical protein
MINRRTIGVLAGSLLLAGASSAAAQGWDGGQIPRNGACFYRDADFRGPYFCVEGDDELPTLPRSVTDNISSIRIYGRAEVRVFKDSRFGGDAVSLRNDARDLTTDDWNDTISSIQVQRTGGFGIGRGGGNRPGPGRGQGNVDQIVRRAYQDVLQRDPDPDGMRTYRSHIIDDGWTEQEVRQALRESPEYRDLNTMTMARAQEIVRQAYLSVLGREPDEGSRGYVNAVYRRQMTRQQLEQELRRSPEFRRR